jgi:two-component system sensor histidine kinase PilS (NtrC family)
MRIIFETGQNFSAYLAARLVFVTVLLGVAAIFQRAPGSLVTYLILFGANACLSLGGWEGYRRHRFPQLLQSVTLTAAVVLDTLVLYYTGRGVSVFVFLYFFSIGAAGLMTGLARSAWAAFLSTAGLVWLEQHHSGTIAREQVMTLVLYGLNFMLTALLASYFHAWFRERERKHRATLGELQQVRLDTQAILDSLSTGVVVVDTAWRPLYSNPSGRALLGLALSATSAEVEAKLTLESPLGGAVRSQVPVVKDLLSGEVNISPGNNECILGYAVSPLGDTAGAARGQILLLSDLTPSKAAERAERERERLAAVGMLSRDLAHEIRNPLATVRGCVEMIRQGEGGVREYGRYLDLALAESDRLNELLRDFLMFAQLDTAHKQRLNVAEFVRRRLPRETDDLLIIDRLPDRLEAECDAEQLGLILDAILLALAEWAEGDGEIRLEAKRNGEQIIRFLLVHKTVPVEYKTAVFQPFSSVNRTAHGLALPTALRAAHANGGQLTLDTELDVGTWFDLKL